MKWEGGGWRGELSGSHDSGASQSNMLMVNIRKMLISNHPQTFMLH